jgi:predicted nucleic acid binding AN1-type Zn finger protein
LTDSKTSTWWRSSSEESKADDNLEAYFKSLKPSECMVCGARATSTCSKCGGKFCSQHITDHSGELLPPSVATPGNVV